MEAAAAAAAAAEVENEDGDSSCGDVCFMDKGLQRT
ncbi:LRRCC1 isoform 5 [Pongo abelii]|uniref:LRRCC1 isoform 2 n=2 Tax=Pongo abelii TaxID=9601 RepID=A0A2J8RKK5_PONAB|nr:LRRCC1 isoform 2 [Pongo abelii]PNJ09061.1 LRRCC1 isoform 3 [Pongo abelii]PNJ09063.1 LRRCC1 isoform 5 [Pongo abelii]